MSVFIKSRRQVHVGYELAFLTNLEYSRMWAAQAALQHEKMVDFLTPLKAVLIGAGARKRFITAHPCAVVGRNPPPVTETCSVE
jgi:hypothetical protein